MLLGCRRRRCWANQGAAAATVEVRGITVARCFARHGSASRRIVMAGGAIGPDRSGGEESWFSSGARDVDRSGATCGCSAISQNGVAGPDQGL
jgi:hypothetical protein